jgi:predicted nucleic acid-binding protein
MAASALVDASFLIALLNRHDSDHRWAAMQVPHHPPPWRTCDAVLSEAFFVLGTHGDALDALLRRRAIVPAFDLTTDLDRVLDLMKKYRDVPMSLADGCLVRMTEIIANPLVLTTDADFLVYRRHGRQVVPCITP